MSGTVLFAILIIVVALAFDASNGWHDAANSIATVVSTRVLSPGAAVLWAAFFNFVAAFGVKMAVARTIGKDVIDTHAMETTTVLLVALSALLGAISWNIATWYLGLPSSSSHALVGGLCGAALAQAGTFQVLKWVGLRKIFLFIVVSPLVGLVLGAALMLGLAWVFRRWPPLRVDRFFRIGQLFSAALFSFGHGANDAQKTMGIISLVLVGAHYLDDKADVPFWVIILCHVAMGLGTALGGWRIVKTMGMRITKLKPVGGFAAEVAGGLTLMMNSIAGIPVSTTHTITGAITGVGFTRGARAVKWGVAGRIVWAWILTIPAAGAIAWLLMSVLRLAGAGAAP